MFFCFGLMGLPVEALACPWAWRATRKGSRINPRKGGDMRNHRPYDPRPHSPRKHDYLQLQKISIGVMSGQFRVEALVMVANGHFLYLHQVRLQGN